MRWQPTLPPCSSPPGRQPNEPARIGADVYSNDKFIGRVAWLRIYSVAANSSTAPASALDSTSLRFAAEFEVAPLVDSGPNLRTILAVGSPFTFFTTP